MSLYVCRSELRVVREACRSGRLAFRRNAVTSPTTCSSTGDRSIFNRDSAMVANAWMPHGRPQDPR